MAILQKQADEIKQLRSDLRKEVKKEALNTAKQLEAFQALQGLVALGLVSLIRDHQYHLIVEFGSGTSTLLELRALELFAPPEDNSGTTLPRILCFEHSDLYLSKTHQLVHGCANRSDLSLEHCPLAPWNDSTGHYSYYSNLERIAEVLSALAPDHPDAPLKLLVVIDGPPGTTCHWARYPAIPVALAACNGLNVSIDFLLDDMIRTDEKEMAAAWEETFVQFGLSHERVDYTYEKGGLLLRVSSTAGVDTSLERRVAIEEERREQDMITAALSQIDAVLAEVEELKQQLTAQAAEVQEAQKDRDDQAARVKALEAEKAAAAKSTEELKQQLTAQTAKVQDVQKACGEQAARVKALEAEKAAAAKSAEELKQQLTAQSVKVQEVQKARDQQAAKLKSVEAELAELKAGREAESKEKQAALEQLSAQAAQLQQAQKARDDQAAKIKNLEAELAQLKAGREKTVVALKRLRHLAHPGH